MKDLLTKLKAKHTSLAWLLLTACLALTWLASNALQSTKRQLLEKEFNLRVNETTDIIKARIQQNGQILLGGAGLFDVGGKISRSQWRAYVERLELAENYPGIQGLGFSQVIRASSLAAHTAAVQAEGFFNYNVHPLSPRPLYTSIVYLEPFNDRNKVSFGYDMMTEVTRATAMRRAVETNEIAISGKVRLVQETNLNVQAGFLMYLPIYGKNLPLATAQARWAALVGFVYSPYRFDDLMQGIFSKRLNTLDFSIFDGPVEGDDARLFSSTEVKPAASALGQPPLTSTRTISLYGHSWLIRFQNKPEFTPNVNALDVAIPVLGVSFSLLMFFFALFLTARRKDTLEIAERMTFELKTLHAQCLRDAEVAAQAMRTKLYERERHQQVLDKHAIVSVTDVNGKIIYVNDKFCAESGYSRDAVMGQNHRMLKSNAHSTEFYANMWDTLNRGDIWAGKICNRRCNGQEWWVEMTMIQFLDSDGLPYQYIAIGTDITELKHNKEALRITQEHFRRGQAGAGLGIWDWNLETGHLFWTAHVSTLLGYAPGQLDNTLENFNQATHPDDRQAVSDAVEACIKHHAHYDIEHRVVWPNGTIRWLSERGAVVRNSAGKATSISGVVQDIHDRKLVELALAESEKRLQQALSLAHLGQWQVSAPDYDIYWCAAIYKIFGRDPANFKPISTTYRDAVHPDDVVRVNERVKNARPMDILDIKHRIIRPDGSVRHVHQLSHFQQDAGGKLLNISGTLQDITAFVEVKQQLQEIQERFAFAVEGAGDGVWDCCVRTGVMQLSGNYARMLNYDQGELTLTYEAWSASIHPDDVGQVLQKMQDFKTEKVHAFVVEYRLRCKDGSYKWILCRATVVKRNQDNQALRVIGIHSDISAQKKLQIELEAAREASDHANQAKSSFLSSMSHELRTPMNVILGFAQLMQYDDTLPKDHQDNVHEIIKGGNHLLKLINEVLELGQIESGNLNLTLEAVPLTVVVEECQRMIQPLATASQIAIHVAVPPELNVCADRMRLKQVLLNLLSNAVKYNRTGGNVSVGVQSLSNQRLRLFVTDTGTGIANKDLDKLFQPFNRLGVENGTIEGTGIGLTITSELMALMGGKIGVESQLGSGSTFWIELSLQAMATLEPQEFVEEATSAQTKPKARRLVLCIDDNASSINLISKLFNRHKHIELITALSPAHGIELARAHYPELILLDINMPGLNGYQVLEILQADALLKLVPVIGMTANAMPEDIERARVAGFTDYQTKPIDFIKFMKAVEDCLNVDEYVSVQTKLLVKVPQLSERKTAA